MNELWYIRMSHVTDEWVMAHMDESWPICHIWIDGTYAFARTMTDSYVTWLTFSFIYVKCVALSHIRDMNYTYHYLCVYDMSHTESHTWHDLHVPWLMGMWHKSHSVTLNTFSVKLWNASHWVTYLTWFTRTMTYVYAKCVTLSHTQSHSVTLSHICVMSLIRDMWHDLFICDMTMGWLQLVSSIKWQVSFAKEPYKRDNILQKRPVILSILLTIATP